jgi:hypothetical protein
LKCSHIPLSKAPCEERQPTVYLARKRVFGKPNYFIRESYRDRAGYLFRDLFELGSEPETYIVYPGGNAFYIDEIVEAEIRARGSDPGIEDLESIFWPFLQPDIRIKLEPFRRRERRRTCSRPCSEKAAADTHSFDKRRIHFLRTGRMAPRSLDRLPQSALRKLQCKSRDEIEQGFMVMESVLRPREHKDYAYAIFNLQRFFVQQSAKENPELLGQDEVDAYFIEEICRLNRDPDFWAGMDAGDRLNDYLVRYLVMYFDHSYAPRSLAADFVRDFINRQRAYRPPETVSVSMQEIAAILGKSREMLKKMSRKDLLRLYRRRAQELHPDKGGDHERFVKLNDAYTKLLRTKR